MCHVLDMTHVNYLILLTSSLYAVSCMCFVCVHTCYSDTRCLQGELYEFLHACVCVSHAHSPVHMGWTCLQVRWAAARAVCTKDTRQSGSVLCGPLLCVAGRDACNLDIITTWFIRVIPARCTHTRVYLCMMRVCWVLRKRRVFISYSLSEWSVITPCISAQSLPTCDICTQQWANSARGRMVLRYVHVDRVRGPSMPLDTAACVRLWSRLQHVYKYLNVWECMGKCIHNELTLMYAHISVCRYGGWCEHPTDNRVIRLDTHTTSVT